MILFEDVSKTYSSGIKALDKVNFQIGSNEFVSLVGKSGSGKTTLIKLLLREEELDKGRILFNGKNISKIKRSHLPSYRQKIGCIFQDYKLLPNKTVFENVAYAMEVMEGTDYEVARDVPKLLGLVGLEDKLDRFPSELSGGEKQRTAIARALAVRPEIIVADEPTGNLDPYHSRDIISVLEKIYELGTTVILATHDKDIIDRLERRVITLDKGKIIRDEEVGRFIL